MKARLKLVEKVCLMATAESGHAMVIEGSPEIGGQNRGVRPMEMLLMGLGGCSAMDVLSILQKQRQEVTDFIIEVHGQRSEEHPKVFTDIHVHYVVKGRHLKDAQVKRAIELSTEKYCSVSAMLGKTANMTHDYEILEEEA